MSAHIVVGVDGSAPSRAALDWAIDRAIATGMPLLILHVVDHQLDGHSDEFTTAILRDATDLLGTESAHAQSRGVHATVELLRGEPFSGLVRVSRSADILVIGTHKTGFIQGRAIGSRFMDLAAAAHCPVAFIPNVSLLSRRGVFLALDDSPTGRRAAVFAATEAERLQQRLTLLYAEPWSDDPGETINALARRELVTAGTTSTLIASQLDTVARAHPALPTKTVTTRRSLTLEAIDASMTAVLVVISHPKAGDIGSLAGAFVHNVIMNLGGPVVVIPRDHPAG